MMAADVWLVTGTALFLLVLGCYRAGFDFGAKSLFFVSVVCIGISITDNLGSLTDAGHYGTVILASVIACCAAVVVVFCWIAWDKQGGSILFSDDSEMPSEPRHHISAAPPSYRRAI